MSLFSFFAVAAVGLAQAAPSPEEKRVMDLTQQACDAIRLGNVAAVERLLAPTFTLVSSDASVQTRDQLLAEVRKGDPRYDEFRRIPPPPR